MLKIDVKQKSTLTDEQKTSLNEMWKRCAKRIILATTLAGSGHPGGSLSALHSLLTLYSTIKHDPQNPKLKDRDRVIVSMGHISPAVYSVLCEFGYVSEEEFLCEFRQAGSRFAGHVEQSVPGVEWNTGNLGQGLSAGCGFALALNRLGIDAKTFVLMGDGEQQKGQVCEARRFATKFNLSNLVCLVDRNHLQIGGVTEEVMPVRVREEYQAAGWNVVYVSNGNDFSQVFEAIRKAILGETLIPERPTVLVLRTVMGKGIPFMEDLAKYHGCPLKPDQAKEALTILGFDPKELDEWMSKRTSYKIISTTHELIAPHPQIDSSEPIVYDVDTKIDCRSAYGNALKSLAEVNNKDSIKILGFSCDLEGSVKMQGFHKISPEAFIECGIQEHHAATCAGAASKEGLVCFFSTFGVFAISETYNQQRLNDLNGTGIKIVSTHLGLDVGEDGPTHQCIDYLGLLNNLFGFSVFMPADPNQTDRIVRYIATQPGNFFVGMGRSKLPIITDEEGKPFFGKDYQFIPGKADVLRKGDSLSFITYGSVVTQVLDAYNILKEENINVSVINMASLKPIDKDIIIEAAKNGPIITVEDHVVTTGLGAMVAQVLVENSITTKLVTCGITKYGSSGKPVELYKEQGLDAQSLVKKVKALI